MACGLLLPGFADAQDLSAKPASFAGELTEGVKAGRVVNKYYADEDLEDNRNQREPVAKAMPSPAVRRKRADRVTADGHPLRRWDGIVSALSTIARNTCRGGRREDRLPLHPRHRT
jgi:hypothetical protein